MKRWIGAAGLGLAIGWVTVAAADQTPLLVRAAKEGNLKGIRVLLRAGEDPNQGDPLQYAVGKAETLCLRALLKGGADLDRSEAFGLAIAKHEFRDVAVMIRVGLDFTRRDYLRQAVDEGVPSHLIARMVQKGAVLKGGIDTAVDAAKRRLRMTRGHHTEKLAEGQAVLEALKPAKLDLWTLVIAAVREWVTPRDALPASTMSAHPGMSVLALAIDAVKLVPQTLAAPKTAWRWNQYQKAKVAAKSIAWSLGYKTATIPGWREVVVHSPLLPDGRVELQKRVYTREQMEEKFLGFCADVLKIDAVDEVVCRPVAVALRGYASGPMLEQQKVLRGDALAKEVRGRL